MQDLGEHVRVPAGWDLDEVLVLYGMAHTSFYVADLAVGQLDQLPDLVRSGRLDAIR